jgi:hypothetical protein
MQAVLSRFGVWYGQYTLKMEGGDFFEMLVVSFYHRCQDSRRQSQLFLYYKTLLQHVSSRLYGAFSGLTRYQEKFLCKKSCVILRCLYMYGWVSTTLIHSRHHDKLKPHPKHNPSADSMEKSFSWEASSASARQEIPVSVPYTDGQTGWYDKTKSFYLQLFCKCA